jgi:hypothetical protein
MCSDEHDQGLALVKMGLRLTAGAFHGGCAQSSEMWRFVPKGLNDSSQAIYCLVSVRKREPSRKGTV